MQLRHLAVCVLVAGCSQDTSSSSSSSPLANPGVAIAESAKQMGSAMVAAMQAKVTGTIHAVGDSDLGVWDATPTECQSGEHEGFYGVDFYVKGDDNIRLRYVHDEASGEVVKVGIPAKPGTVRVFDRESKCTVLEGSIERSNATTWTPKGRMRHVAGRVKFDCTHSGGAGHVSGELTFEHCH